MSFFSLLQVHQRFKKIGGVPRDIFKNYSARERSLEVALADMDVSQVTKATCAADTFSAASHQLILITVPEWRTGQPYMSAASHWCMFWVHTLADSTFAPCR